ncbi:hypothetical protein [Nonomuraea sp. NPDC049784]|uniref:hypothetical protein n=1 Tax=Nonomuraea sp. NPDC049784 TaxID=3154361 RepID=UPI0033DECEDF
MPDPIRVLAGWAESNGEAVVNAQYAYDRLTVPWPGDGASVEASRYVRRDRRFDQRVHQRSQPPDCIALVLGLGATFLGMSRNR